MARLRHGAHLLVQFHEPRAIHIATRLFMIFSLGTPGPIATVSLPWGFTLNVPSPFVPPLPAVYCAPRFMLRISGMLSPGPSLGLNDFFDLVMLGTFGLPEVLPFLGKLSVLPAKVIS